MLTVSVHKSHDFQRTAVIKQNTAEFAAGKNTVLITADAPYGFMATTGDLIIAGEALAPLGETEVKQLAARLNNLSGNHHLGYKVSLIVIINKLENKIQIFNSINSCRIYYLFQNQDRLVLSSSLLAMKDRGVDLVLNENALPEIMVYRYTNAPSSPIKNVRQLSGGEFMEFNLNSLQLDKRRAYNFPLPSEQAPPDLESVARIMEKTLTSNITDSLATSAKPGVLLSGGLDSSLLALLAVRSKREIASVSTGFSFANKADGESEYATSVADHLGLEHRLFKGTAEIYLRGFVEAVYHAEMPVHHLQSVMLYLLFRDAQQQGIDLFLNGESADSILGFDGHMMISKFQKINRVLAIPPLRSMVRLAARIKSDDYHLKFFSHYYGRNLDNDLHVLYNVGQYTDLSLVAELFGYDLPQIIESHRQLMRPFADQPLLNQVSIVSLLCEASITMSVWSKLAEAASIRISYPFASEELIDQVFSIPWEMKVIEPKYIIRKVLRNVGFKEEFITRPKQSFGFPINFWAPPGCLFQPLVDMASEMFDQKLLKTLQRDSRPHAMLLWNLLNIYLFDKLIIKGADHSAVADEVIDRYRALSKVAR